MHVEPCSAVDHQGLVEWQAYCGRPAKPDLNGVPTPFAWDPNYPSAYDDWQLIREAAKGYEIIMAIIAREEADLGKAVWEDRKVRKNPTYWETTRMKEPNDLMMPLGRQMRKVHER